MHITLPCLLHLSFFSFHCDSAFISAVINCEGQCQRAFRCNLLGRHKQEVCFQYMMLLTVATVGDEGQTQSCDNVIQCDRGQYALTLSCHAKV